MNARGLLGKARTALLIVRHSGFPWAPRSAIRHRQLARRSLMQRFPFGLRSLAALGMTVTWPVSCLVEACRVASYALPGAVAGRSRVRLALDAWVYGLKHNFAPTEYIAYRLFDAPEDHADQWLSNVESGQICRMLSDREALELAEDKDAFAVYCEALGIPAVPTLALYKNGVPERALMGGSPPERDLVVKPRRGAMAVGIAAWRYETGTFRRMTDREGYLTTAGPVLSRAAFQEMLAERSTVEGEILVQPWLRPHRSLSRLSDSAVGQGMPVLRVVTGRWPSGEADVIAARLQRPPANAFASQAGPYGLLDCSTGRVLPAAPAQCEPVFELARNDPEIENLRAPDWEQVRGNTLTAHRAFPGHAALIGWDVAPTDHGPVLLEANLAVSFFQFQMASGLPAVSGKVRSLIEAWL